jgi:hypothetical protein
MTDDEMTAVLAEIVRDEAAPARVTAIRTLREWRRAAEAEEGPSPFDELYADELAARRRAARKREERR